MRTGRSSSHKLCTAARRDGGSLSSLTYCGCSLVPVPQPLQYPRICVLCNVLWDFLRWGVFVTAAQLRNVLGSNYHLPTAWRARKPISSGSPTSDWSQWLFYLPPEQHCHKMISAPSAFLQWGSFVLSDSWMGQCSMGQKFCSCDLSILDHCQLLQFQGSFCKDKGLGLWSHKYICSLELGYYPIKPFILLMKRAWSMSNRQ